MQLRDAKGLTNPWENGAPDPGGLPSQHVSYPCNEFHTRNGWSKSSMKQIATGPSFPCVCWSEGMISRFVGQLIPSRPVNNHGPRMKKSATGQGFCWYV